MAKGASIKFTSYDAVPKLLELMNLHKELKKYDKIVLKVPLTDEEEKSPSIEFIEPIIKFILQNRNPVSSVFIAEGAEGADTEELFEKYGFKSLAEKYEIGLIDLNTSEVEEVMDGEFLKFQDIKYPKILKDSFLISVTKLMENEETMISGALPNMLGAFPLRYYKGFFSKTKNKLRDYPIKYAIHDITKCKMPDFSIIDASEQGRILAGLPLEMDKQSAKLVGFDWKNIPYLKLIEESISEEEITSPQ